VDDQEDWTKTEVVSIAQHDFLNGSDSKRIKALVRYRKRKLSPSPEPSRSETRGRSK